MTAGLHSRSYDLAIVGSGFAGSLLAMIARRLGLSVVLIERGKHPRVVIGESSTPITNLLLEELTTRYDLPAVRPLAKWGSWQKTYPEIACGLKRGFTFYHHDLDRAQHSNNVILSGARGNLNATGEAEGPAFKSGCHPERRAEREVEGPASKSGCHPERSAEREIEGPAFKSGCHPERSAERGVEGPASPLSDRTRQLLVAASPHDEIADTHWYRADFDHFLVREAQKLGVDYFDETNLTGLTESDDDVRLEGTRHGRGVSFTARFVVDATGPRGFLHRALGLRELDLPGFPPTQSLYGHFENVRRLQDLYPMPDGQSPLHDGQSPPYPVGDAAVHHVFDGGWIWVLQFNNGITSAGVAATDSLAEKLNLSNESEGAAAWQRLIDRIPALKAQFAQAKAVRPFARIPRLSFRSGQITGHRWALLPSAAGFVDPLLSSGFPLTLLGISRLVEALESGLGSERFAAQLQTYAAKTEAELLATSDLVGALYASMSDFPVFASLSLLYFAAVSFSEAARRLGKPHLASSFLLHDHPVFGPACRSIFERARQPQTPRESADLTEEILRAIEPFNVAGLGDPRRRNWYPVNPEDLIRSAHKLEASPDEALELLKRCGFQLQ
jgi:tetracycline 7-halogenase / FADH2 O2-dependent halogenase